MPLILLGVGGVGVGVCGLSGSAGVRGRPSQGVGREGGGVGTKARAADTVEESSGVAGATPVWELLENAGLSRKKSESVL